MTIGREHRGMLAATAAVAPCARLIETAIAAAALGALAAVVYGPHTVHGGFISDAWFLRATHEFAPEPGLLGTVRLFVDSP